jgi:DtxR family Mn-dependent transcriptional regulator
LQQGWLEEKNGAWALTGAGLRRGFELLGAHRTWEQFMVENLGYDKTQVHAQAEDLEHFLTPQLVDEIQSELGRPLKDPHGAYIPQSRSGETQTLLGLENGQKALLLTRQSNEHVMAMLWQAGLAPNHSITIVEKSAEGVKVRIKGAEQWLSTELAQSMQVVRIA